MKTEDAIVYSALNGATVPLKIATPTEKLLTLRLRSGIYRYEEGDLLKRCSRCKEHWPADSEFFYSVRLGDGLHQWCKACYQENRYPDGRISLPNEEPIDVPEIRMTPAIGQRSNQN
jgi:hypothetical protein